MSARRPRLVRYTERHNCLPHLWRARLCAGRGRHGAVSTSSRPRACRGGRPSRKAQLFTTSCIVAIVVPTRRKQPVQARAQRSSKPVALMPRFTAAGNEVEPGARRWRQVGERPQFTKGTSSVGPISQVAQGSQESALGAPGKSGRGESVERIILDWKLGGMSSSSGEADANGYIDICSKLGKPPRRAARAETCTLISWRTSASIQMALGVLEAGAW